MATSVTMNDNILPNSKKIIKFKKLNPTPSSKKECEFNDKDANCKKYETFNNNQKMGILTDLKKGLMQICKLEYEEKESFVDDLLELLPVVDLKEYNKLLGRVLTKHIDSFITSPKILTQWRKKIKGWIHNTGKPENRGNPLVPFEKLDNFRNEVIRILKNLPFRCFPLLRQNILKVLERFHKEDEIFNGPQPFNTNVCSKHWWFNFMQRNQDIKTMWESIPLEREGKKLKAHAQKQHEEKMSMKIEEEEGKEEEPAPKTSSLHMADPIFSGPPAFMPPPQNPLASMTTMPTMSTMPTLPPMPTLAALPRLFAPVSFQDPTNKAAQSRVPDPYFVSMKALEFLFASRDALKKSLVEINQSQNQANNQQTEMKTEEHGVKEEINVKIQPFVEKEEDMTDSTKISPNNELQTVKTEETRVKIEVEALPATMESESSDIKQTDS